MSHPIDAEKRQQLIAEHAATLIRSKVRLLVDPTSLPSMKSLAEISGLFGLYRDSFRIFKRLLKIDPVNELALEMSMYFRERIGKVDHDEFKILHHKCIVIRPDVFGHCIFAGIRLRNFFRFDEAGTLLRWATILDPDSSEPHEQIWKIRSEWGFAGRGVVGSFHVTESCNEDQRFFRTTNARFFPRRMSDFENLDTVLRRDIFYNYLPERPLIGADQSISAFGSCFAQHIRQWLIKHGRVASHVPIPEGLNNTFAIRQFVDWMEGRDDLIFSYEKTSSGQMERWDADKNRATFRDAIAESAGFVVTIGVGEVWREKRTGGVYWRGVPAGQYDPDRHEHSRSTVQENVDNLIAIAAGLRRLAGDVPVVYTLSPVPLIATMRSDTSIFAADAVSKSTLRLAIEEVVERREPGVRYWPSFEAFRWLGAHLGYSLYDGENNPRHPNTQMIGRMISLFVESYFEPRAA